LCNRIRPKRWSFIKCLEPFFTTKGERGTGLVLAMVYGMVQRHSAEIDVESAGGAGEFADPEFMHILTEMTTYGHI
jgi:hypothetical protein